MAEEVKEEPKKEMTKSEKNDDIPLARDARRTQSDEVTPQFGKNNKNKKLRGEAARPHAGQFRGYYRGRHASGIQGTSCFMKPVLHEKYDSYYCPKCLIWLENKCDASKNCLTCQGRTSVRKALAEGQ